MKKLILIALLAGLSASAVQAQYFVASYGYVHNWDMPYAVSETLEDEFWGYDLIHAQRIEHHGNLFFMVMLQRGSRFTEVKMNRRGRILEKVRWNYFPYNDHVCDAFCGFHSNYYLTYYRPDYFGHQHYNGCGHYVPKKQVVYYHKHKQHPSHGKSKKAYGQVKKQSYTAVNRRRRNDQRSASPNGRTRDGYDYSRRVAQESVHYY